MSQPKSSSSASQSFARDAIFAALVTVRRRGGSRAASMGGRADEDEFGNAPEPVAPAEYIRALAAYQARRGGNLGASLGGNGRYHRAGGLTSAFRGLRVRGESPSDDESGSESDGEDDRGMRVMGRATMKARSSALLEVKGGYRMGMGRNDENAMGEPRREEARRDTTARRPSRRARATSSPPTRPSCDPHEEGSSYRTT